MARTLTAMIGMVAMVAFVGAAQSQAPSESKSSMKADQVIAGWKDTPKNVAKEMIGKYGEPQEVTKNRLIWHNNGPWKYTNSSMRRFRTPFRRSPRHALSGDQLQGGSR